MSIPVPGVCPMLNDPYETRLAAYKQIEAERQSRVIAYVTGDRPGMQAQISHDAVDLLSDHLDEIFPAKKISLLLYTIGGNTLAAWNMITMLRMFCENLEIIIPSRARSAGTLMSLGADTIIMTKQATLGPIDPSLSGPLNPQVPGAAPDARAPVSVEAIRGYIEMAKQDFGVKAGQQMTQVLIDLADKVHPLVLGSIFRSRAQIQFLARELLKSQVKDVT
jgi:membrane-bound ClpP family serine protease